MITFFNIVKAHFDFWRNGRKMEKGRNSVIASSILSIGKSGLGDMSFPDRRESLHNEEITIFRRNLEVVESPTCIGFGDSLLAFPRNRIYSINKYSNFSQPGAGFGNIHRTVKDVIDLLHPESVRFVLNGCGGNAMLARQNVGTYISDAKEEYEFLLETFPNAVICHYSIPPVLDLYTATLRLECNALVAKEIVARNSNRMLMIMFDDMVDIFKIFPMAKATTDGIHFSPMAERKFDGKILKSIHIARSREIEGRNIIL